MSSYDPTSVESHVGRAAPDPHPERVKALVRSLAELEADPTSPDRLARVRDDIRTNGLSTFFQAASERLIDQGTGAGVSPRAARVSVLEPREALAAVGKQGSGRLTWADSIGRRVWQPLRVYRPTTLEELRSVLRQAAAEGCRVKAVGSGHSFSDVAVTRDFLIDTQGLRRPLPLTRELLRPDARPETLFETEAGITVRELNDVLWEAGLGLVNMGGYDGQTIAGVVSTSTHGSGLAYGPLSSQVESLTVVSSSGKTYRIEPARGITDPERWAQLHPDIELRQDDDWFNSCQVGVGCLGVIYSVVLRVRGRYFLREERSLGVWSQVKRDLADGQVLHENDHYEVLVNPYQTNGDHTCLITRRNPCPEPTEPPLARPRRNFLVELIASIPGSSALLQLILDTYPELTPSIIDAAMAPLARAYVDRSYYVYNIGAANEVPAYGSEIGFPLEGHLEAVERILKICEKRQRVGQAYLTSPFSLRYVKASPAYLSMMYGADTCMVEFPLLSRTVGGAELLQQIEVEMYALGGRPHWGLLNFLSGANGLLEAIYPMLPRWLEVFRHLSPEGTFTNAFTERCGITPMIPART